jgi:hypothetical protein
MLDSHLLQPSSCNACIHCLPPSLLPQTYIPHHASHASSRSSVPIGIPFAQVLPAYTRGREKGSKILRCGFYNESCLSRADLMAIDGGGVKQQAHDSNSPGSIRKGYAILYTVGLPGRLV